MGRPKTLLADICDFASSRGADSLDVGFEDGKLFVYSVSGDTKLSIANFDPLSEDGRELLQDLYSAARKPANALIAGHPSKLYVGIRDHFGHDAFSVTFRRAAASVPAGKWSFTSKQGQFLAYIYQYSKIHRRPPAELDLQDYFQITPPSVHNMILTLERKGLIDRTPGQARSIHVLVPPEELPPLE